MFASESKLKDYLGDKYAEVIQLEHDQTAGLCDGSNVTAMFQGDDSGTFIIDLPTTPSDHEILVPFSNSADRDRAAQLVVRESVNRYARPDFSN